MEWAKVSSPSLRPELGTLTFDADTSALDAEKSYIEANNALEALSLPGNGRYVEDIDLKRPFGSRFVILADDVWYSAYLELQAEQIDYSSVAIPEA